MERTEHGQRERERDRRDERGESGVKRQETNSVKDIATHGQTSQPGRGLSCRAA